MYTFALCVRVRARVHVLVRVYVRVHACVGGRVSNNYCHVHLTIGSAVCVCICVYVCVFLIGRRLLPLLKWFFVRYVRATAPQAWLSAAGTVPAVGGGASLCTRCWLVSKATAAEDCRSRRQLTEGRSRAVQTDILMKHFSIAHKSVVHK